MIPFEVAGGTVLGRSHALAGRGNQDALFFEKDADTLVAVVADGCGSGVHSEVGAHLGARLVGRALLAGNGASPEELLARARDAALASLLPLVTAMGPTGRVVTDYFLFTLVGAVVRPDETFVFTLGDGVFALNGEARELSYPDNRPPYLGYALSGSTLPDALLGFQLQARVPTRDVRSLVVGTDGVAPLLPQLAGLVDADVFRNPMAVTRRLTVLSRTRGLLPDDATLVALRRRDEGARCS